MSSGKVKWFDNKKGYGFLVSDAGQDVFVHHTSIKGSGFKTLQEGELVHYELVASDEGPKSQNVQRVYAPTEIGTSELTIGLANVPKQDLIDLLRALNRLHIAAGGDGFEFSETSHREG